MVILQTAGGLDNGRTRSSGWSARGNVWPSVPQAVTRGLPAGLVLIQELAQDQKAQQCQFPDSLQESNRLVP